MRSENSIGQVLLGTCRHSVVIGHGPLLFARANEPMKVRHAEWQCSFDLVSLRKCEARAWESRDRYLMPLIRYSPQFLLSALDAAQFPAPTVPEIAFLGRSNVGKSS